MDLLNRLTEKNKYLLWLLSRSRRDCSQNDTPGTNQGKGREFEKRDLTAQVYGNGTVRPVVVGVSSKITGRILSCTLIRVIG